MVLSVVATVLYGQIGVHDAARPDAPTRWTAEHVARGVNALPGHVAFGVPDHDGECAVEVRLCPARDDPKALSVAEANLDFGPAGAAVLTGIETWSLPVPAGRYTARLAILPDARTGVAFTLSLVLTPA